MLDTKNVDSKLSADIQLSNAFADPFFRNFYFKNSVLIVNLYVIENMIGCIADCCPFSTTCS
jgi:hypothetical protein